jgi:hypothetical protein
MRVLTLVGVTVTCVSALGIARPRAADCRPLGNVQFVCGQAGPEDLAVVPGSHWIIASGYAAGAGSVRLIDTRDNTTTVLYPTAAPKARPNTKTYDSCPGPLNPQEKDFRAHGIYLRPGKNSVHTLYVVHHGDREAVEVFEFDARPQKPTLTWIGCAVPPDPVGLNAIVGLPDDGIVATNFQPRNNPDLATKMRNGEKNGELWEWHTSTGWKIIPGTEASGANGVEISKDGKWLYVAGWGDRTFMRVSRGQTPVKRDVIPLGFRVDNLRWSGDALLGAGQGGAAPKATSVVVKINPTTLKVDELLNYADNDTWGFGTVAVQVGKDLWVGSVRGERIARFPAAAPGKSQ